MVHRFHEGAVNTLVRLAEGGFASAGEDRRIALWRAGEASPTGFSKDMRPCGRTCAGAGWPNPRFGQLGWNRTGSGRSAARRAACLDGHRGPVHAVAYLPDGTLVSGGYDGLVRLVAPAGAVTTIELGLPVNTLAVLGGEILAAGADGQIRFIAPTGGHGGSHAAGRGADCGPGGQP